MASIIDKVKDKLQGGSGEHQAALLKEKGTALVVETRPTPKPDAGEIIVEVKSVALNPVDYYQRDYGMLVQQYPAVLASDVGGIVASTGSGVSQDLFKPGTRVTAFATAFYKGTPDYGALQQYARVSAEMAAPIPEHMSFNEAAMLPMSVGTTWNGYINLGVPRNAAYTPADKRAILIWGGSSSIGTGAIQVGNILGFTTYVTASSKQHEYLKTLGASKLFDYKDPNVAQSIIDAVKADGVKMDIAYHATGDVQPVMQILKELNGSNPTHVAHAPMVPEGLQVPDGMKVTFVQPSNDEKERLEQFSFIFNKWLKEQLESGQFKPAPKIEVVNGGLKAADGALNTLREGASAAKYVIEVD